MKTPKEFYQELGKEKLSKRKEEIHTEKELNYVMNLLDKSDKVLDAGCGYGRFTIPLAKEGYNIEGIDIAPNLVRVARNRADNEELNIEFKIGDIRNLPYEDNSFDKVICLWSVLIEISNKIDQIKAIKEIYRVLKPGGFAFIEMPIPLKETSYFKDEKTGDEFNLEREDRVVINKISGVETMPVYIHNKDSLEELMNETKIEKYKVYTDNFGGRDRLLLKFWKK